MPQLQERGVSRSSKLHGELPPRGKTESIDQNQGTVAAFSEPLNKFDKVRCACGAALHDS